MTKEVIYKLPTTRPKIKKYSAYQKITLHFDVEVTIDEKNIAGSEFNRIKHYIGTTRGLRKAILSGIDSQDHMFRDIDPQRSVKVKVKKKG